MALLRVVLDAPLTRALMSPIKRGSKILANVLFMSYLMTFVVMAERIGELFTFILLSW